MDSHKYSTQVERLEVVETGRRRRWSDDEKLRIVIESLQTPRAISSTARRHGISRSLLMRWQRSFRPEPIRDGAGTRVTVLSPITLDKQIGHDGATWLDRELTSTNRTPLTETGFGRDVASALERRKQALAKMGHVTDLGNGRFRAPKDLIQRLERGEIERTGQALAAERGRTWQPAVAGNHVTGKLVGSAQLASGRFAMIDDGMGFTLVPWQPVLEQRIGQRLSSVAMPGGGVDWSFARSRGLGL